MGLRPLEEGDEPVERADVLVPRVGGTRLGEAVEGWHERAVHVVGLQMCERVCICVCETI
jgi:hypothetical protein